MPRLGLLLALLIASVPAFGQDRRSDEHSYAQPDKVRIRDLALDLDVDFDKRQLSGSATLGLEWVDPAQRDLVLDTRDLAIAAVEARNGKRKFREVPFVLAERDERFGSKLTITLPRQYEQVRITYATSPEASGLQWLAPTMTAGRQLPFMTVLVLFWLMAIMDGWRGVKETWPAVLVGGGSFAVVQFLTANYIGPELPDITSAIVSLVALTLFLKVWQPKRIFRFDTEGEGGKAAAVAAPAITSGAPLTAGAVIKAWSPFIILTAMVTVWSIKPFKALFAAGGPLASTVINIPVPFLHNLVEKTPPVVAAAAPYGAVYTFNWLLATGTAILIAALITITFTRLSPAKAVATLGETFRELAVPIYSIGMVLAFAFVANYSGLSATLALALAHTGQAFTFFSPFLGWIGVFLTGSDTSANALFAALQATTAQQLGLPQVLTVAANTTGGVTGKMISPQSIAIACAAVGLAGRESDLFRFTVKHSLIFTTMVGLITLAQAYWLTWMIP